MKINRSWISLVGYCLITVLAAALAFAVIVAGASVALASHQSDDDAQASSPAVQNDSAATQDRPAMSSFNGMITDSYCGARHMRYTNLTPAQCAATCIRSGASYVLVDGDRRYKLSGGTRSLGKFLGTRASVSGTLQGDTILVNSAGPIPE